MPPRKRFVCFANSRKTGGRCLAGKEIGSDGKPGPWIRPISFDRNHAIPVHWQQVQGADIDLLDIVSVGIARPDPLPRQAENHLIDIREPFARHGRIAWEQIDAWLDQPPSLWGVADPFFGDPYGTCVPESYRGGNSLYLIRVADLRIFVVGDGLSAPKIRGQFSYRGAEYRLPVTDVLIEAQYKPEGPGQFELGHAVLCISLGDPFNGKLYKLIAAVLHDKRFA